MFSWILLVVAGSSLVLIVFRRLRMTRKDLLFQEHLAEEELGEEAQTAANAAVDAAVGEEAQTQAAPAGAVGTIRKTFLKADMHSSRNEFEEAEPLFVAIITEDPSHLDAHHKLGLMYMKMGRFGDAELYFSKLVNLKQDPVYFSNLGAALYQQQRLIEAAEAYENAIALDDKRGERLQSLGQVYYELGENDKALHYFERAARRKPKDLDLKVILADLYESAGRNEDASEMLKAVLDADPYNKEVKGKLKSLNG